LAESAVALLKRDAQLCSQQSVWMTRWQDIADFVAPEKSRILTTQSGPIDSTDLYDGTAIHGRKLLSSMIHGTMTPSTQPWVSFVMRDEALNDQQDIREWLEDVARRIHKALRQSNFTTGVHEMYEDLTGFATGCILTEEKDSPKDGSFGGFRFTAIPIGTYRIAEDKDGVVDTVFRDVKLSRRVCVAMWGAKCGETFLEKAKNKPDEIVEVLHAVYPRRDMKYDGKGEPRGGSNNLPWASCYVLKAEKIKTDEGGFEEMPYAVPRWSKIAGEVYGTGPSHVAIYDVKTLNAFKMFWLQAIPLAMQPPSLEKDDTVQGDLDRAPGGRIVVTGSGALADNFMFMDTKFDPKLSETFIVAMRQDIERMYHSNELQLREGSPQMTATEAQIRYEFSQRILGPTTGRLESEFLNPLTWRCFSIMARRGAFKALPSALQQAVGTGSSAADLDVQYEGPLARAQRTIELTAQDRTIAFIAGITEVLAPVAPDLARKIWNVPKIQKMIRERGQITGLPSDSLNSEAEVAELDTALDEASAQQQKKTDLMGLAEAAGKVTPMLKAAQPQTGKAA